MTGKGLLMFFMVGMVLSIGMSGIAHAIESDYPINGSVIDNVTYGTVEDTDTSLSVTITLDADMAGVTLPVGGVVTVTGVDSSNLAATATATITNTNGISILSTDLELTGTVDLSGLDYSSGDTISVVVDGTIDDGVTTDRDNYGGDTGTTITISVPTECGYENLPDIVYNAGSKGDSDTQTWSPTITDTSAYDQPDTVTFTVGDWFNGNDKAVDNSKTTIDDVSVDVNDQIVVTSVDSTTTFDFATTLDFVSDNAYAQSIGQTLQQTTTVAYSCSP